jgi:nitric oxide reductase subunit B
LYHSVSSGYFDARTLQFITGGANPVLEWLRLPGDVLSLSAAFCRFSTCAG